MSDDKIDFGPLDPARDQTRWQITVDSVVARAVSSRVSVLTVSTQLRRWAVPTLAAAAVLAAMPWALVALSRNDASRTASSTSPASELSRWAAENEVPATHDLLQALGEHHDDAE